MRLPRCRGPFPPIRDLSLVLHSWIFLVDGQPCSVPVHYRRGNGSVPPIPGSHAHRITWHSSLCEMEETGASHVQNTLLQDFRFCSCIQTMRSPTMGARSNVDGKRRDDECDGTWQGHMQVVNLLLSFLNESVQFTRQHRANP